MKQKAVKKQYLCCPPGPGHYGVQVMLHLLSLPLLHLPLHYQPTSHQDSSAPLRSALLFALCPLGRDRRKEEERGKERTKEIAQECSYQTILDLNYTIDDLTYHITPIQQEMLKSHIPVFYILLSYIMSYLSILLQ